MCLAIPGRIVSIHGDDSLERYARVSFEGLEKNISLACVPTASIGDYVLVHVGLAINVIDEKQAALVRGFLSFDPGLR